MMTDPSTRARILREARVAGLAKPVPSLADVDGRRLQLWGLTSIVMLAMAAAFALSAVEDLPRFSVPPGIARAGVAALSVAFLASSIEKEVHLRRLSALLVEERVRAVTLQADVERLLEAARIRSEVVASVGTGLRAPLDTILRASELLGTPLALTDREHLVERLRAEGLRMASLVDNLLDAAAFEREGPPLDLAIVDMGSVVRASTANLPPEQPVEVDAHAVLVRASAEGLRRIVDALVANAFAHGRPPVRVTVAGVGDEAILTVADSGPGIPEADRRRVFELLTRLDSAGEAGLGLGLTIVAGLAAAWGGRAWVDEAPGGGAAVRVALPRA